SPAGFVAHDEELLEAAVTLFQPVAVSVRRNGSPFLDARDAGMPRYLLQLFLAAQVVADILEMNLTVLSGLRVFDQQRDSNGCTAAAAEDLAALLPRCFARGALIAAQMEHVKAGKLLGQTLAEAV